MKTCPYKVRGRLAGIDEYLIKLTSRNHGLSQFLANTPAHIYEPTQLSIMPSYDLAPASSLALAVATAIGIAWNLLSYIHSKSEESSFEVKATLKDGLCGHDDISISRLPLHDVKGSSLQILLGLFHERDVHVTVQDNSLVSSKQSWNFARRKSRSGVSLHYFMPMWINPPSQKHRSADGSYEFHTNAWNMNGLSATEIGRTTLINLLVLSNARTIYEYSDSSGYRAAFGGWTGQWYINWRAGQQAVVTLRPHDSHSPASDVYPPVFPARVSRAVQMMAGVVVDVTAPQSFSVAFPGRLSPGYYRLRYQKNGFGLSHGSRHIYNMNGGKVFEIDFLLPQPTSKFEENEGTLLKLPSLEEHENAWLYIGPREQAILADALDRLPWANLSWSMHRGMRDILLAFASERMDAHREALAQQLRNAAQKFHTQLVSVGWNSDFAKSQMGDMAASAILARRGNSGDAVRIVTALAEQIHGGSIQEYDHISFWGKDGPLLDSDLTPDEVVALVKCFVIEWSQDFDYQIYHQLPITLLLG